MLLRSWQRLTLLNNAPGRNDKWLKPIPLYQAAVDTLWRARAVRFSGTVLSGRDVGFA